MIVNNFKNKTFSFFCKMTDVNNVCGKAYLILDFTNSLSFSPSLNTHQELPKIKKMFCVYLLDQSHHPV